MAKGFGSPSDKPLGYVLMLLPEIYAAKQTGIYDNTEEKFIGITNMLEQAHIWQSKKQAEKAINDYMNFLIDEIENGDLKEIGINIKVLRQDKKGNLKAQTVNQVFFSEVPSDIKIKM